MSAKSPGPTRKATHDDIIRLTRRKDRPVITASDITAQFGVSRAAANTWLDEMVEEGKLDQLDVGSSAVVYWLPERASS